MKIENQQTINFCDEIDILINKDSEEKEDYFYIKKNGQNYTLEAKNLASIIYARKEVKKNISKYFFDKIKSSFKLRILWINCTSHFKITENLGIYLPEFLKDFTHRKKFCEKILELGYNSVIFGNFDSTPNEISTNNYYDDFESLLSFFYNNDINFIINPILYFNEDIKSFNEKNTFEKIKNNIQELINIAPQIKYFFWKSFYEEEDFQFHPAGKNFTKEEKTIYELKSIRENLPSSTNLLFYLPSKKKLSLEQQTYWLENLFLECTKNIHLVFSAVSGNPDQNHLNPHPMWKLSKNLEKVSILPIINIGCVNQGEGLWPNVPYECDYFLEMSKKNHFPGMIHLCPELPKEGSFLDGLIDTAGKSFWYEASYEDTFNEWLKSYHEHSSTSDIFDILKKIRMFLLKLNKSKESITDKNIKKESFQEEARCIANALISELSLIEFYYFQISPFLKKSFKDYFPLFFIDMKNYIKYFLNYFHIPIPPTFGTSCKEKGMLFSPEKGKFVQVPEINEPGSLSHKLLWERNFIS